MSESKGHIYLFIHRNNNLAVQTRIFYVGSSKHVEERICEHIKTCMSNSKIDVYNYLSKTVGIKKFDVYLIHNNVNVDQLKIFERIYHDELISQQFNLKNCYKPIPECHTTYNDLLSSSIVCDIKSNIELLKIALETDTLVWSSQNKMINKIKRLQIINMDVKCNDPHGITIQRLKEQVKNYKKSCECSNEIEI